MWRRFVISVGGAVIAGNGVNVLWAHKLARLLDAFFEEGYRFAVVTGGGRIARQYAEAVRALGGSKTLQDQAGILATKMNAWVMISAIKHAYYEPLNDIWKAASIMRNHIPVLYGGMPGVTSDYNAALLAEATSSVFLNVTNVDGIYTADPHTNPDARLIERMDHASMVSLISEIDTREPGAHTPIDLAAAKILARSKVPVVVVGPDVENIRRVLEGKRFRGTRIISQ